MRDGFEVALRPVLPIRLAIKASGEVFGLSYEDIVSPCRRREMADARHVAMLICHEDFGFSSLCIGRVFNRHHTTVLSGIERIARMQKADPYLSLQIQEARDLTIAALEAHGFPQ